MAIGYITVSIFEGLTQGWTKVYPAFCLPGFCYPVLPTSIIVFGSFMLLLTKTYKWHALPFTIATALSYDLIGSFAGIDVRIGLYAFWLFAVTSIVYYFWKSFNLKPNWYLVAFLAGELAYIRIYAAYFRFQVIIPDPIAITIETILEIMWCFAFRYTFLPPKEIPR